MEDFFHARLTGTPKTMLFALPCEMHQLEKWRRLCLFCDPPCAAQTFNAVRDLKSPPQARHLGEVIDLITKWEAKEARVLQTTGFKEQEEGRYLILLEMCTKELRDSLRAQQHTINTYEQARSHIFEYIGYQNATKVYAASRALQTLEETGRAGH